MALEKITSITGRGVFVPGNDIDTDRIIPARFMKCVTFDGLGEFLFFDWRKDPDFDAEIRTRCESALMEATPDQVVQAAQGLKAFYQRAAANKDAVLFRVT